MKLTIDYAHGRVESIVGSLTITAQVIVAGDTIVAEPELIHGNLAWTDRHFSPGDRIGSITVES